MNLLLRFKKHYLNQIFLEMIKKELIRKCTQKLLTYIFPAYLIYPATISLGFVNPHYF